MKHTATELMKFKKLKRRLGVPLYVAVGILETLWIATQRNAPKGDIGKYTNEEIAIELEYEGDADSLIHTLVELEWLDESETHRLVVHDWPSHAPRYIHGIVSRNGGFVADYSLQLQSATTVNDCTGLQPNLTKPNLTIYRRSVGGDSSELGAVEYESILPKARKLLSDLGTNGTKRDKRLALVCLALREAELIPKDCVRSAVATTKEERPENPVAYFRAIMRRQCDEYGWNLNQVLSATVLDDDMLELTEKGVCSD